MVDKTESIRREMVAAINRNKSDRQILEEHYGQVWDRDELQQDFIVEAFFAPFILIIRLAYQHSTPNLASSHLKEYLHLKVFSLFLHLQQAILLD